MKRVLCVIGGLWVVGGIFVISLFFKTHFGENEWTTTSWDEIGLEKDMDKFFSVMPLAEGSLENCELFLSEESWNEFSRPSIRYVYGRIKLDPKKKDFYRKKVKEHPSIFGKKDSEMLKTSVLFPFVVEICKNACKPAELPPRALCILVYSHTIVALTNSPELFMEDTLPNSKSYSDEIPYIYFYFSPHEMFRYSNAGGTIEP